MQQVGARGFATAQAVDARHLPVPARNLPRRAVITLKHAWVLHRRLMLRAAAAGIVLVGVTGLYEAREQVWAGALTVADLAQGEFARAGLGIATIDITGQALTNEQDVVRALQIGPKTSIIGFDADAARARILELQAIKDVTIRKIYPGELSIVLEEKVPVARWRIDDTTFVVDVEGRQIAEDTGAFRELPLVVGDGAADDALVMIKALDRYPALREGLAALSRIGDRRWDLIYYSGLRVQLPESGAAQALDQLELYQRTYGLLDRDVTQIDLRVAGIVALKPGPIAAEAIATEQQAAGRTQMTSGPSDYATPAERQADTGPEKP